MKHELPKLEYEYNALEPFIDEQTLKIHHGKHHQTYVDKLNLALDKHPVLFEKKLGDVLSDLDQVPQDIKNAVRNMGGGHYNHALFWVILKKDVAISDTFKAVIEKDFESFDNFKKQLLDSANNTFGSGWGWLALNKDGKLEIISTSNQDSPLTLGKIPILTIDVWEHAYYLKYQNRRIEFTDAVFQIINWHKVEELYTDALKGKYFDV